MTTIQSSSRKEDNVMEDCSTGGPESASKTQANVRTHETITLNDVSYTKVKEGKGEVLFPAANGVFYNPVQEFNRDISVAILQLFALEYEKDAKDIAKRRRREAYDERVKAAAEAAAAAEAPQSSTPTENSLDSTAAVPSSTDTMSTSNVQSSVSSEKTNPLSSASSTTPSFESLAAQEASLSPECEPPVDTFGRALPRPGVRQESGLRVLEALSASGLRSIRYAREVGGIKEIIANDLSQQAVECMQRNIEYNGVEDLITASHNDASTLLYLNRGSGRGRQFDVVDLDPYGSPHLFLDGAVQAVTDGGLLLVTCTDMAVLCGVSPGTSYAKYGATSMKTKACHEMALRIALQALESHANRYGRYIEPLISFSVDFYIRVAVKVHSSPQQVKQSYSKVGLVFRCVGCGTITTQPIGNVEVNGKSIRHKLPSAPTVDSRCEHCDSRHEMGGPIWLPPIHDLGFLERLADLVGREGPSAPLKLGTQRRILGMLQMMQEELPDVPLYYVHDKQLCSTVGVMPGKLDRFMSALLNAGYRVSLSHCNKTSIKTDAPASVVWDVVRAHEQSMPAHRMRQSVGQPGHTLLNRPIKTKVDFTLHPGSNPESRQKTLLRFQKNPERFWGPSTRSTTKVLGQGQQEKKVRNQSRRFRKRKTNLNKDAGPQQHGEECSENDSVSGDSDDSAVAESVEEMDTTECVVDKATDGLPSARDDEGKENTAVSDTDINGRNIKRVKLDKDTELTRK